MLGKYFSSGHYQVALTVYLCWVLRICLFVDLLCYVGLSNCRVLLETMMCLLLLLLLLLLLQHPHRNTHSPSLSPPVTATQAQCNSPPQLSASLYCISGWHSNRDLVLQINQFSRSLNKSSAYIKKERKPTNVNFSSPPLSLSLSLCISVFLSLFKSLSKSLNTLLFD